MATEYWPSKIGWFHTSKYLRYAINIRDFAAGLIHAHDKFWGMKRPGPKVNPDLVVFQPFHPSQPHFFLGNYSMDRIYSSPVFPKRNLHLFPSFSIVFHSFPVTAAFAQLWSRPPSRRSHHRHRRRRGEPRPRGARGARGAGQRAWQAVAALISTGIDASEATWRSKELMDRDFLVDFFGNGRWWKMMEDDGRWLTFLSNFLSLGSEFEYV